MVTPLVRRFQDADVDLSLLRGPIRNGNRDIFQMDVFRSYRNECIRIWPGAEGNRLTVPSVDPVLRQLILLVQEPVRTFTVRMDKVRLRNGRWLPPVLGPREKIVATAETFWEVERRTDAAPRRFLCGMDESHLFVAQFSEGETVAEAHASLRPPEVEDAERRAPGETVRQGEWFFVPLGTGERDALDAYLRRTARAIEPRAPVGPGWKPHVADQVVVRVERRRQVAVQRVYARGRVCHPDHRPLELDTWRRVVRNREVTASQIGANGVFWFD